MPRASRMPGLVFNVEDWLTSKAVLRMSHLQRGYYFHLLCLAWLNDEPGVLEGDDDTLAGMLGISVEEWGAHREPIGRAWDRTSREGFWVQPRLVEEHEKQVAYLENARKLGAVGAGKRWNGNNVVGGLKGAHRVPIGSRTDYDVDSDVDSRGDSPPTPRSRSAHGGRQVASAPEQPTPEPKPPAKKRPDRAEYWARVEARRRAREAKWRPRVWYGEPRDEILPDWYTPPGPLSIGTGGRTGVEVRGPGRWRPLEPDELAEWQKAMMGSRPANTSREAR